MGRTQPSRGAPPSSQQKDARAKRAKQTVNKDIPALLKSYPQVQAGIDAAELISSPAAVCGPVTSPELTVRVNCGDTLEAAATATKDNNGRGRSRNVVVLNMASPLRPGGGFLNGATSQEESLCMRTTLLPSLKDEFYRLPEVGGIYTSDVLVFRSHDADATDLPKNQRFCIDVISSAMHRMPEIEEDGEGIKRYVNAPDRLAAEQKIRAVMRIARGRGAKKIVLGAWGCGAYGNPVQEISHAFHKVLMQESPSLNVTKGENQVGESWNGMECIFAINDRRLAHEFAEKFGTDVETSNESESDESEAEEQSESLSRIAQLEHQIANARSDMLRERLRATLEKLKALDKSSNS